MNIALIPAAGTGVRFNAEQPKQYTKINQLPILLHTLQRLSISEIDAIYILLSPKDDLFEKIKWEYKNFFDSLLHQSDQSRHKLSVIKVGGDTRTQTVLNALNYLVKRQAISDDDWVLVHDSVRCCLPSEILQRLIKEVHTKHQGAILAKKVVDTVKQVNDSYIQKTIDRSLLWLAQTPQMFLFKDLMSAYTKIDKLDDITDEASLLELIGKPVSIIVSDDRNLKITVPQDVYYAKFLLTNME